MRRKASGSRKLRDVLLELEEEWSAFAVGACSSELCLQVRGKSYEGPVSWETGGS